MKKVGGFMKKNLDEVKVGKVGLKEGEFVTPQFWFT